ncbi:DUF4389 domain-containing protein [Arthrobacter liuii]|uniref:DUF4389 domain-containing protein n=1 Tax=Arthrobacter liuii TaxID=1476996 RepID=A0ABQ2AMH5_9MICC|nr:DUF4389 domain-containing protein [Arthrobacter liuii]GGH92704.1 hypothetical protein GCM10007170_11880 [Arthrobacter liuii]
MKKPAAIIMLILGILITLPGLAALAGGAVASAVGSIQGDGYLTSGTSHFSVSSFALTSPRAEAIGEDVPGRLPFDIGTLRLRVESVTPDKPVFIGIGPQADVERYLSGVHHSELLNIRQRPFRAEYRDVPGGNPASPPADQRFWTASVSGSGEQELTWNITPGTWEVVVMNADASSGVDVRAQAGFRSDLFRPAATGLLVGGIIALVVGIPLIIFGAAGLGRHAGPPSGGPGYRGPAQGGPPTGGPAMAGPGYPGTGYPGGGYPGQTGQGQAGQGPAGQGASPASWSQPGAQAVPAATGATLPPQALAPAPPAGPAYPARLFGEIDPGLSRWMWLVKWFLAIPHFFLLFFLWFAFAITTIVAGFAILFTGRYPRALFDFNVGVLRWNWRVAFYAYAAVGTDLYPPFTLKAANYPADFEVEYPQRLSRGLVLVKWWLLTIPHLLLVAAFTGTTATVWRLQTEDNVILTTYERGSGISLLGLLVLIAAVILLFSGRYQRPLFDLILGINRWIYRVLVYTALMRDEYPPFRLDQGAGEPEWRGDVTYAAGEPPAGVPPAGAP